MNDEIYEVPPRFKRLVQAIVRTLFMLLISRIQTFSMQGPNDSVALTFPHSPILDPKSRTVRRFWDRFCHYEAYPDCCVQSSMILTPSIEV